MLMAVDKDRDHVRCARFGEFAAFGYLVARHEHRVYLVARRILRRPEDAEDVVQETFLSAIKHLKDFREEAAFRTWLLRIATNHALKILRKQRGLRTVPLEEFRRDDESRGPVPRPVYIAKWREDAEREADRPEIRRLLDLALGGLAPMHRVVILLRDVEGLSTEDAARALGISVINTRVRLFRARLKLRERLPRSLGDTATRGEGTRASTITKNRPPVPGQRPGTAVSRYRMIGR